MEKTPWTITDRKVKISLIGCGRISANHFKAIEQHSDRLTLDSVCDIDGNALDNAATQYGVPGFLNLDELLASRNPDLVILCTPSGLHPQQAIKVAQNGHHVLTEKPMATRWQDGLDMVKACDEHHVRLFVVKQNRLNTTLQLLKQAVSENRFGKIQMVNTNVFWTRPQDYYDQATWRGTWEFDGGAFMNQASHYIDLLHWLVGPIESIHAMTATMARNIEAEDSGVMNVKWRNGALGSVCVSMLTYPKNYEGSITILGEKGTVRVGGVAVNEIQHWEFAEARPEDEDIKSASYQTNSVYGHGHPVYYDNVINVLQGKDSPLVDGREGLSSLELLIAAYRSARSGDVVHLPLEL